MKNQNYLITNPDGTPLDGSISLMLLRLDEHGDPIDTAAARDAALCFAKQSADTELEAELRTRFARPKAPVFTSLFAMAQSVPATHKLRVEYPPGSGNESVLTVRLLTGEEQVQIQQYEVDDVVPPRWGPATPDTIAADRQGEYDLKNPKYLAERRAMANRFNAYLVDCCLGLGLPEGTTLEQKAQWLAGQAVDGLPPNSMSRGFILAIINAIARLNYGSVVAEADFT